MRKVFFGFAVVQLVAVLAQFYLATFGAFETPQPAPGDPDAAINYHVTNGSLVIPLVSLLTTTAALAARAGGKLAGLSILPLVLAAVQLFVIFPLAELAGATDTATTTAGLAVMGFHALDGVAILAVAVVVVRRAGALIKGVPVAASTSAHTVA
ncbi:hypothetical protein SAMN05421833_128110 [Microbispora rosea]|uniref:Uncharacterized protein n=1 Tax=Microbispora rosea TaxID=58117 RepID=A0A1N7GFN5_9ACTN|nr:DUF6220 domain-containing protein [Microbispora rosea]GIH50709.1 hypothetical protein Mro03_58880 [Microbispora rosea subsp. rosea]SIS11425.1 hypothetical protein SAMN05421833_128110 [Microbispora rosea]